MRRMGVSQEVLDYCSKGIPLVLEQWKGDGPSLDLELRNNLSARENPEAVERCIRQLLQDERIFEIPENEVLTLNPLTLVIQKTGKERLCIDVSRKLNPRINCRSFRLCGVPQRWSSFRKGIWMAKLDLKNGYLHIPVQQEVQRHLSFRWNGRYYCYKYMAFGINIAPLYFQTIMNSVLSALGPECIYSTSYLDDVWIEGKTASECRRNIQRVVNHLEACGFTINKEKSVVKPTQTMEYLGLMFDSRTGEIRATEDKIKKCKKLFEDLRNDQGNAKLWHRTAGFLNFLCIAVPEGRSHMLTFHRQDRRRLPQDTRWWLNKLPLVARAQRVNPSELWTTDASAIGQGAWNQSGTHLRWKETSDQHSNVRELNTVLKVLQSKGVQLSGRHVHFRLDNTSAVSTLNKGGSKSIDLNELRKRIWNAQRKHDIMLTASWIPGVNNTVADALSRGKDLNEKESGFGNFTNEEEVFSANSFHLPLPVETLQKITLLEPEQVARESWKGTDQSLDHSTMSIFSKFHLSTTTKLPVPTMSTSTRRVSHGSWCYGNHSWNQKLQKLLEPVADL